MTTCEYGSTVQCTVQYVEYGSTVQCTVQRNKKTEKYFLPMSLNIA